jgi:hypothetical protein
MSRASSWRNVARRACCLEIFKLQREDTVGAYAVFANLIIDTVGAYAVFANLIIDTVGAYAVFANPRSCPAWYIVFYVSCKQQPYPV